MAASRRLLQREFRSDNVVHKGVPHRSSFSESPPLVLASHHQNRDGSISRQLRPDCDLPVDDGIRDGQTQLPAQCDRQSSCAGIV